MTVRLKKVKKAIIPVAGLGTRFLPATKAQPKEMLPIVDTPIIQFLVEEAVAAGIEEIIFVTGKGKRAIEDHFDYAPELENVLAGKGKGYVAKQMRTISDMARFAYVRQKEPKGDGDAILMAAHLIDDEPVVVLFGDDLIMSESSCLRNMLQIFEEQQASVLALEQVPKKDVSQYGIVSVQKKSERLYKVSDIVEKPKTEAAPSRFGIVGKYIIAPSVIKKLARVKKEAKGGEEVRLADALKLEAKEGGVFGYLFEGERFDCGSKLGFLKATVQHALRHPETNKDFAKYLKKLEF